MCEAGNLCSTVILLFIDWRSRYEVFMKVKRKDRWWIKLLSRRANRKKQTSAPCVRCDCRRKQNAPFTGTVYTYTIVIVSVKRTIWSVLLFIESKWIVLPLVRASAVIGKMNESDRIKCALWNKKCHGNEVNFHIRRLTYRLICYSWPWSGSTSPRNAGKQWRVSVQFHETIIIIIIVIMFIVAIIIVQVNWEKKRDSLSLVSLSALLAADAREVTRNHLKGKH